MFLAFFLFFDSFTAIIINMMAAIILITGYEIPKIPELYSMLFTTTFSMLWFATIP
jgi:hypothetical protein